MDKKTCIIVEDDIAYQKIITFFIKKVEGLEILGAYADTVNASIQIEKQKPDIVFLDINISGLEGPEFMELLDHQPQVIMVSAHNEKFMNENYDIPYSAYIQKPIDLEKLKAAIQRLD